MTPTHFSRNSSARAAGPDAPEAPGWSERVTRLFIDVRALARDHIELAVLETQRAGQVLVQTVAAAVAVSVLVATAWLGIVAAIVVWLTDAGVSWPGALLIGAVACLAVAGGIVFWVKKQIPELMFSATLRQLRATASVAENLDDDADNHAEPPPVDTPSLRTAQTRESAAP